MNTDKINILNDDNIINLYQDIIEEGTTISGQNVYLQCKRGSSVVRTDSWYSSYWGCYNSPPLFGYATTQCRNASANSAYIYCVDSMYRSNDYAYLTF